MSLVSSVEAAEKLQLTRQRVAMLLRDGHLVGEQTARGQWLINTRSINEYQARKSGPGRPWSAETSWALLAELDQCRVGYGLALRAGTGDPVSPDSGV